MLHLIPAPLHRILLRMAHAARIRLWRLLGTQLIGCRVIALDGAGRVLLVRHHYGSGRWMPPGGTVRRGEAALAAGVRELREETACALRNACEVAVRVEDFHRCENRVHVIVGITADSPRPDGREIAEAWFFPLDALPPGMAMDLGVQVPRWAALYRKDHSNES